jgi:hypothetical protein
LEQAASAIRPPRALHQPEIARSRSQLINRVIDQDRRLTAARTR